VSTQKKIGRKLGKIWEKIRIFLGKNSEIFRKKFGNFWEKIRKFLGLFWENFGKSPGIFGRRDCQNLGGLIFGSMNLGEIMMMIF
jgi:hypothetical protein